MRWDRTVAAALVLAPALVAATACSDSDGNATPPTSTVTVTAASTAPAVTTPVADPDTGSDAAGQAALPATDTGNSPTTAENVQTPCGPRDLSRTTIDAAIAKIAPDALGPWGPTASNFSTCNDISYVVLENGGGMAASDDQLLIFGKQGNFLGTGIRCITSRQNVRSAGRDFVTVDYSADRWITTQSGEQTRPTYPVTFRWNGSRVVMEGTLPYEITRGRC